MGLANNKFGATATVPVEAVLQQLLGSDHTTPQTTANKVGYFNLTGKVEATPTWTIEGAANLRVFKQKVVDGNPTATQPCEADPGILCFNSDDVPANGLKMARPACQPVRTWRCARRDRPHHDEVDYRGNATAGNQYRSAVRS